MYTIIALVLLVASSEHLGPTQPSADTQVDVAGICMGHISKLQQLFERGVTKEAILDDFEDWLKTHTPIVPQYPQMVREMISDAGPAQGWEDGAFRKCVASMNGQNT